MTRRFKVLIIDDDTNCDDGNDTVASENLTKKNEREQILEKIAFYDA